MKQKAEEALFRYLNPYTGGPQGNGWPFGRELHLSEIHGLLQGVPGVDYVEKAGIQKRDPANLLPMEDRDAPVLTVLTIPPNGLICSAMHQVAVR